MLTLLWLGGLVRRRSVRVLGVAACVALSVASVASLGAFLSMSEARMTSLALAGVPVDWQVELAPGTHLADAHKTVARAPDVLRAIDVGYGQVAAFTATTGPTVQTTGAGRALGLPASYATAFPSELRYLLGARTGVLFAQQTAANLHVGPGDTVAIRLPGGGSREVRVDGIVDLPQADSLFQIVGAPPGAGATAPPDNVVLLPLDQWRAIYGPIAKTSPEAVRDQIHVELAHDQLPADPQDA